jgi:hypothetical protein
VHQLDEGVSGERFRRQAEHLREACVAANKAELQVQLGDTHT